VTVELTYTTGHLQGNNGTNIQDTCRETVELTYSGTYIQQQDTCRVTVEL